MKKTTLERNKESVLLTLQDLLQTWGDRGDERERMLYQAIRKIGVKGVAEQLQIALGENPPVEAIEHTIFMIQRILKRHSEEKSAFYRLTDFLGDSLEKYAYSSDPKLAEDAVWAIGSTLTSDRLFQAVAHGLLSNHKDVRVAAQFTMCSFGRKALRYLLQILPDHTHEKKFWNIVNAIGEFGGGLTCPDCMPRSTVVKAIVAVLPAVRFSDPLMAAVEVLLLQCGSLGVKTVFQLALTGPTPKVKQEAQSELLYHARWKVVSENAQKLTKSKDKRIRELAHQVIAEAQISLF